MKKKGDDTELSLFAEIDEEGDLLEEVASEDEEEMSEGSEKPPIPLENGEEGLPGMIRSYFLDYASYVILDRAVPYFEDGLKPVQRRILHSLWEKHDGRYHKVANLIGHTMQYHPHGDAAIGDALVNMGQKGLLIDTQGNWGNILTGDSAAAPRYIEGRLTPFAVEVLFNPEITHWAPSYDGRAKEPLFLPARFPLLLAQGTEGIAVGLSTKILPHNFGELLDGAIAVLRKKPFELYPDFPTGGIADCSAYQNGARGGRVKVRAVIDVVDRKMLRITQIPFGTTTGSLIDSIIAANDKGRIKIKKVEDNTAQEVDILIHLPAGVDPLQTVEALYTFTECELSIAVNCCVVIDRKPQFTDVKKLLKRNVDHIVSLLQWDLANKLAGFEQKWHLLSLERIFIEKEVYEEIKKADDREEMIALVDAGMRPHIKKLRKIQRVVNENGQSVVREVERELTREDILKLVEIPIRRISRFDAAKNQEVIAETDQQIAEVVRALAHLVDYTIAWFRHLQKKYASVWPRKTRLTELQTVAAQRVAVANQKMYVDRVNGFIGTGLRKEEFLFECSPYDELIVFRKDAVAQVVKVSEKSFVGKGIVHVEVFDRKDRRRVYNVIYQDGGDGRAYIKRFQMGGVTRDREYSIGKGTPGTKLLYLSSAPNGESDLVEILLKPRPRIKLDLKADFGDYEIKGRGSQGRILTRYPIKSIKKIGEGKGELGALELWWSPGSPVVTMDSVGNSLGGFEEDDLLLVVRATGKVQLFEPAGTVHVGPDILYVGKLDQERVYSALVYDGEQLAYYLRRFCLTGLSVGREYSLVGEQSESHLLLFSADEQPSFVLEYQPLTGKGYARELIDVESSAEVRGWRAKGSRLSKIKRVRKALALSSKEKVGGKSPEEYLNDHEGVRQFGLL